MTRLTHREAAEAVLTGKGLLSGGYGAGGDSIRLSPHYIDQPSCYTLADPTPQPTEAPMTDRKNKPKIENRGAHGFVVTCDGFPKAGFNAVQDAAEHFAALIAKPAPAPTLSITVNGVTNVVAAPVTEALAHKTEYWLASPHRDSWTLPTYWMSDPVDRIRLSRGLIHKTEAAARAHAMAMVGLKEGGV